MEPKTETDKLFDAIEKQDIHLAHAYLQGAKKELELVKRIPKDTDGFKNAVKVLAEFIKHVEEGNYENAKARGPFRLEIKYYLQKSIKEQLNRKENSPAGEEREDVNAEAEKEKKTPETQTTANSKLTDVQGVSLEERTTLSANVKVQRSDEKQASEDVQGKYSYNSVGETSSNARKIRRNNPDIADLSDINRPTKLAERFSELYDNEWTEVFDSLQQTKAKETDIVQLLLLILQEAYGFCTVEADQQIKQLTAAFLWVIAEGKDWKTRTGSSDKKQIAMKDSCVLVQIRKECAADAIPAIKEKFAKYLKSKVLKSIQLPAKIERIETVDHYCEKAVELTWWMCVQDPPVYMCPIDDNTEADKNVYRAYTKSGDVVDYYVWPALRLYEGGGVLAKGVVQYK